MEHEMRKRIDTFKNFILNEGFNSIHKRSKKTLNEKPDIKVFEKFIKNISNVSKNKENSIFIIFNNNIDKIENYISQELTKLGIDVNNLEFLSSGGFMGIVFSLNDKIIKLSVDISEIKNIEKLMKIKPKYFAKYYWYKNIPLPDDKGSVYVICMEKLKMLSNEDKNMFVILRDLFENNFLNLKQNNDDKLKQIYNWFISSNDKFYDEKKECILDKESIFGNKIKQGIDYWKNKINPEMFINFSEKMKNVYLSGNENGIDLDDFHADNTGYNSKGDLVAFDCKTIHVGG